MHANRLVPLQRAGFSVLIALGIFFVGAEASARPFRPSFIPNGNTFSCSTCHFSPGGGDTRTPFGLLIEFGPNGVDDSVGGRNQRLGAGGFIGGWLARRYIQARKHRVAHRFEPLQSSLFDDGFGEAVGHREGRES